ncbi:MAG: hypothetical protein WCH01_07940 [Methylococcaceae bacterium]
MRRLSGGGARLKRKRRSPGSLCRARYGRDLEDKDNSEFKADSMKAQDRP